MSGGDWPDEFKLLALNGKLEGSALDYYEKMLPVWVEVSHTPEYVMNSMLRLCMTLIPSTKGIEMMTAEKDRTKTWPEDYQFLVYVAERSGNTEQGVLECLCKSAPPHIKTAMLTRLNTAIGSPTTRNRACRTATEEVIDEVAVDAVDMAAVVELPMAAEVVVETDSSRGTCYGCREVGNVRMNCADQNGDSAAAAASARVTLAVGTGTKEDSGSWILDSESSVHLVRDQKMLKNTKNCDQMCHAANNTMLRTVVDGKEVVVDLTEVYYFDNLSDNIISYGRLEERGVFLERHSGKSYVVRQ
ncbi:hypothetical protein PHMEG_00027929 [Phytophthora megakarya]|uniref:Uncharacterized protein n=1 Tax=Phytophthora megakarya TaxID=4795 RepID=A0A225V637_9STRA|nr:hypothetical protein PHMEG_00027929 [Phytophthora megakarya]